MKHQHTLKIMAAAEEKFGTVVSHLFTNRTEILLVCKRDNAPIPERPFMTIRASVTEGESEGYVSAFFYSGHYDIATRGEAMHDMLDRAGIVLPVEERA